MAKITIGRHVELLHSHFPYHESDPVLNRAFNAMADGTCLEDLKKKRGDEAYLNALGAKRIPEAPTAGDFCRRFESKADRGCLQTAIDEARRNVRNRPPDEFSECAAADRDGSIVETTGECKFGRDLSYEGLWGDYPLLRSRAETREPLRIVHRSGNQTSEDGAAFEGDGVADYRKDCGFRKIVFRGDTAYRQTQYLDRRANRNSTFSFGDKAMANVEKRAEGLDTSAWTKLKRMPRHNVTAQPRAKGPPAKENIVIGREDNTLILKREDVAEFAGQPAACGRPYRMIVIRKQTDEMNGQKLLR